MKPISARQRRFIHICLQFVLIIFLVIATILPQGKVFAATTLAVTPLTWNIIGLDSNDVNTGPNHFPVGARVCNTGAETALALTASFVWDTTPSPTYINIRPGTSTSLTHPSLAPDECTDFYFEVEVTRNAAAYKTVRQYHIAVTADGGASTGSTPTPRELYVERLISQSRNTVSDIQVAPDVSSAPGTFASIASSSAVGMVVGGTYWVKLIASTATNGYEQIESFINFPDTIFQVQKVDTTYSVETSANMTPYTGSLYDQLYGDGCIWDNDPNSPTYRSCLSTGKAGGNVTVTYKVTVISMPYAPLVNPEPLNTLIYDFSGSSFHYNANYDISRRSLVVVDPTQLTMAKSFSPATIPVNGVSALTFTISNPYAVTVNDVNFTDVFPAVPGAMTLANATVTNTCGGTLTDNSGGALAAGSAGIRLAGGVLPANGSCIITVNVTAPTVSATPYNNVSQHLMIGSTDTNSYASASLTVSDAPPAPAPTCGTELAVWTMGTGTPPTPPVPSVAYSYKSAVITPDPTSAYVSSTSTPPGQGTPSIDTLGLPANAWKVTGGWAADATGYPNGGAAPYYEFAVDTSAFTNVTIQFNYMLDGNWANANNNELYVYSSTNGTTFTNVYSTTTLDTSISGNGTWYTSPTIQAASTNPSGTTTFRINFVGQQQPTAYTELDNVIISGCRVLTPPNVTKSFSPSIVAVGGTSTLTFNITNPNLGASATLSGIDLNDFLPQKALQGTVSVTNGSVAVTGAGTAFRTQLASGSVIELPGAPVSLSGVVAVTHGGYYVTGTGTAFTTEVSAGSRVVINSASYVVTEVLSNTSLVLASAYQGTTASGLAISGYKRYTVSSIASDTSLTLTTAYAGATASNLTLASGLTLTAAPTTTCRGTVTGASGAASIVLNGNRAQGLVSTTGVSATVTGSGTAFQTQFQVGSRVLIGGYTYRVAAIASQTSMTVSTTPPATSNQVYFFGEALMGTVSATNGSPTITGSGTSFNTQIVAGDTIYINSVPVTVLSVASATSLTLSANWAQPSGSGMVLEANRILRGTVSMTRNSTTVTGTGTYFASELAAGNVIYLNGTAYTVASIASDTSLTLVTPWTPASASGLLVSKAARVGLAGGGTASCTVTASVRDSTSGAITNISDPISADESGANNTSTGIAIASLNALLPPVITKQFSPNPILVGGVSTLTFTITNPNQTNAISGLAFSDTFPTAPGAGMVVAAAPGASSTCGGAFTFTPTAAAGSITFPTTGTATLAAGASCTVTVNVTAPTATGDLSGTVAVTNGSSTVTGTGTAFTTQLAVGYVIYIQGMGYTVAAIASNTSLTLSSVYAGPTGSGLTVPSGYFNVSGTVSYVINGATVAGNSASDTLLVDDPVPGIAVMKQVGPSATGPWTDSLATAEGSNIYYRFVVENTGDVALASFTVTDPVLVPASPYQISCTWETANVPSTLPGLPVATATVDPTASCVYGPVTAIAGSRSNTATAHGVYAGVTYDSTPDTATYHTTGLTIAKSAAESYYTAVGDTLHYSYLVSNSGYASLMGPVTVADDRTTVTCPDVSATGDGDLWLDPGESLTCTSTYTIVSGDIGPGAAVQNTASASAYLNALRTSSITSEPDSETVPLAPDLAATKTNDTAGAVILGNTFHWTLLVSNDANAGSASFANGATLLTDNLPTGAAYTVGSITYSAGVTGTINCALASDTLTCSAGSVVTIPYGDSFSVPVTVTPGSAGSLVNPASAGICRVDPGTAVPEILEDNNGCADTVTVNAPDLSISKTDGITYVSAGGTTIYTIQVSNIGTLPADGAIFTDPAASNLTVTSVTCGSASGGAACPAVENTTVALMQGAGIVIPTLPSGGSVTFSVTGTAGAAGSSIPNAAAVSVLDGLVDANTGNNSATDTDTIIEMNFGHLPSSYTGMNLFWQGGAWAETGATYLGGPATTATDGINNAAWSPKMTDDGVAWTGNWINGTGHAAVNVVCPTGTCYLYAWVDWNNDSLLTGQYEAIYAGAISTGSQIIDFTFPGGGNLPAGTYYARFRLYAQEPASSPQPYGGALTAGGASIVGEIEDPIIVSDGSGGTPTPVTLAYFSSRRQGSKVMFNWSTATETGNAGFNLYVAEGAQKTLVNPQLILSRVIDSLDPQHYSFSANVKGSSFYIGDVSILGVTRLHGPFQVGRTYGTRAQIEKIDLPAIQAEHNNKIALRQDQLQQDLRVPAGAFDRVAGQPGTESSAIEGQQAGRRATVEPTTVPLSKVPKVRRTPVPTALPTAKPRRPTATVAPTTTPLPIETETVIPTATPQPTATETVVPTDTPQPTETAVPTETPLPTETVEPTPTATPVVTEEPPAVPVPYDPASLQLTTTFNLKVNKTGIYRVTYEMLRDAGLDLAGVPVDKLAVLNRDMMVPLHVSMPESAEAFGAGGFIEFYGEALDTLYTDTNIYTVQVSGAPANRIPAKDSSVQPGAVPPASYPETLVVNNQRAYVTSALGADPWYDTALQVSKTARSWSFTFQVNGLAPAPGSESLNLLVWGMNVSAVKPNHHMLVYLNGVLVGNELFDGIVEKSLEIALPAGVLKEGANTLRFTLPADTGATSDVIVLDRYGASYQRSFMAQDGRLRFTMAGDAFRVSNLPDPGVVVYRIRDGGLHRLENVVVQPSGTTYAATFAGSDRADTYLVDTVATLYTPGLEITRPKADLNRPAQYLIIAHPDFISGLQPLVEARQAQGLAVSIVDVNDLYAQYTYSIFDPRAIKQYITHAARNLGAQYVLLVGGDTYDYRNYLGKNSISFIPSLYASTGPSIHFSPVDPLYTDLDGDYVPDLAIGRFPVRTSADLDLMVRKTLAYAGKDYGRTAVFASDTFDGIVSFKDVSNRMAAGLPGQWTVENIHMDDVSVETARAQLLAAMNRGTAMVTFTGHSGPTYWAFNNLFTMSDAAALSNAGKPFITVQWGCWNTYYVHPTNNYLVQNLLFSGDRGAAAVFGATGLADSGSEEMLGQILMPRLVVPGAKIGQALQQSKAELAKTHPDLLDVLLGWSLMGDPALLIEP